MTSLLQHTRKGKQRFLSTLPTDHIFEHPLRHQRFCSPASSAAKESCPQWTACSVPNLVGRKKNLCLEVITERFRIWTSKSQPAYPPPTRPHRRQSCPGWAETTVGLSNSFDSIFSKPQCTEAYAMCFTWILNMYLTTP